MYGPFLQGLDKAFLVSSMMTGELVVNIKECFRYPGGGGVFCHNGYP